MKYCLRKFFCWICFMGSLSCISSCFGKDGVEGVVDMDKDTLEIMQIVQEFSEKNDLKVQSSLKMFSDVIYEQKLLVKGGVGIVSKDIYVDLTSSENKIIFNNKSEWVGRDKNKTQVVTIINGKMVDEQSILEHINSLVIIVFLPEKVQVYDLTGGQGGFYLRNL